MQLDKDVRRIFIESRESYGSPRVLQQLKNEGKHVGKRGVEAAMSRQQLVARKRRAFRRTTVSEPAHEKARNILNREFSAKRPHQAWVTDITYIQTDEGWCYFAVVIDLYSGGVVGWSLSKDMSVKLPLQALDNALVQYTPEREAIHHSDRGCQYTSREYRDTLVNNGLTASMSRKGNCWDNAVAESFFHSLKVEALQDEPIMDRETMRQHVFEYIEVDYNKTRRHSALGYLSPENFELKNSA